MVLKKEAKNAFSITVRGLVGKRLGFEQLVNKPITMRLYTEKQARLLMRSRINIEPM